MFRKLLIAAVAGAATLGVFSEPTQADARPRVRFYSGPNVTSLRWRGGVIRSYHPLGYYRPYNRGVTITYGQPYYGYGSSYPYGYSYPNYGYGYGYTYPQYGGGVYYSY